MSNEQKALADWYQQELAYREQVKSLSSPATTDSIHTTSARKEK